MKKIGWNEVTWYSKIVALALFIILPILAFWFGVGYGVLAGKIETQRGALMTVSSQPPLMPPGIEYYSNVSEWQTYSDAKGGFAIAYPIDFGTNQNFSSTPTTDWQIIGNPEPGTLGFTLMIPASFEPQTNFDDAKLTVGWSGNSVAVAECMSPSAGGGPNGGATSTVTIGNANFTVIHSTGVGAGNTYDTTSYRAIHNGQCYAIEYTIHSSQILNFPAEYNLHPFDAKMLTDLLDRIVGTFRFN